MHRILNKPLFMSTDISRAQRKESQQKEQHCHSILMQIQGCACELPCPSPKLHPDKTRHGRYTSPPQTMDLLTTQQIDSSFGKANPLSNTWTWQDPPGQAAHSWTGCPLLYQAESFFLLKGSSEAFLGAEPFQSIGKRHWSHKNLVFYINISIKLENFLETSKSRQ